MSKPHSTPRAYSVALHVALVGLAVVVLLLVAETRRLRGAQSAGIDAVEVGDQLPTVAALDLDGRPAALPFAAPIAEEGTAGEDAADRDDLETVLLVFTTTCPACKETLPAWTDLWRRHGARYRIVGVALAAADEARDYARENELPFPVVVPDDPGALAAQYGITGVPQTLLVDTEGRVKETRLGALDDSFAERLARL